MQDLCMPCLFINSFIFMQTIKANARHNFLNSPADESRPVVLHGGGPSWLKGGLKMTPDELDTMSIEIHVKKRNTYIFLIIWSFLLAFFWVMISSKIFFKQRGAHAFCLHGCTLNPWPFALLKQWSTRRDTVPVDIKTFGREPKAAFIQTPNKKTNRSFKLPLAHLSSHSNKVISFCFGFCGLELVVILHRDRRYRGGIL